MTTRRCDECGAAVRSAEDRFCAFCGAAYVLPSAQPSPREAERAETEQRFALLADHPKAKAALAARVSGASTVARHGAGALFAVVFLVIAGSIAVLLIGVANHLQQGFDSFPTPDVPGFPAGAKSAFFSLFKIGPLVVVGVAVIIAIRRMIQTTHVATSPTRASLGHVLDEHTETRGSRDHVRTVHVVTLESPGGRRSSHEIRRPLALSITQGDMGVVHTRGRELVRFTRIDV